MKRFSIKSGVGFLFTGIAAVALFSFIVMSLWNGILVAALHASAINFWQAAGILVLSKILFGGFPGRRHHGYGSHHQWGMEIREKWQRMTPEEREKFKDEWKDRCRKPKQYMQQQQPPEGM